MILVTGASGKLGSSIVEQLLNHIPADRVIASTRDPEKLHDLNARGVEVRRGNYTDPASLRASFEGVGQILMVSSNSRASSGDPLAEHRNAIDAAVEAGVGRIIYTSHMGASAISAFPPMRDHAATEDMLRGCGLAWTSLRNGFYASTVPLLVGQGAKSGIIEAPEDGRVSWTTHRDLAEAAVRVLTDEGCFDGPTPPLTAELALDLTDVAGILTELTGQPVTRRVVSDAEYSGILSARGLPKGAAETVLALVRASHAGEFSAVDPTLARLIGRDPTSVRQVLLGQSAG